MGANTVLFLLPIFVVSTLLPTEAQPLVNDQPLPNENDCVSMSDETADKIKEIVHELIDFIESLAEKHEDVLDLRLVKLDIDNKHIEPDIEDQNTVLELFVNDCGKRFVNFLQNSTKDQTNNEVSDKKQSLNKDVDDKISNTSDNTLSVSQDVTGNVQKQKENVDSEVNIKEKSKTKNNKKNSNKSKYRVVTNKEQDKVVTEASKTSINKDINRKDQTTTTINLNRKKKSNRNIETSNNFNENKSSKKVDSVDTKNSSTKNTNIDYESDKKGPIIRRKLSVVDNNSEETDEEYDPVIDDMNNNNSTNESVDDCNEESTENTTNESVCDDESNDNDDLQTTEKAVVKDNTKSLLTGETKSEFNNRHNKLKITDNNNINKKTKQSTSNNYEGIFLDLLKQIIRNEVNSMKENNSTINSSSNDNQSGTRNDINYEYNDVTGETDYYGYESRKKPELVILDLPDDLLHIRDQFRGQRRKRDPIFVYLQEQMGQQRILIL